MSHFCSFQLLPIIAVFSLAACTKAESAAVERSTMPEQSKKAAANNAPLYPPLSEQALLAAFQRGAREVPDFLRIAAAKCAMLENNPPNYLIKGILTYEVVTDTFRAVRTVGAGRNSVTLVDPVRRAGETLDVEFSQRIVYSGPSSTILPPLPTDRKALGLPKPKIPRAVESTSAEGVEAIRQAGIYEASQQKLERIGSRSVYASRLITATSEDAISNSGNEWWGEVEANLDALGYNSLTNEIRDLIFNNATFAKLPKQQKRREIVSRYLAKEILPAAQRLVEEAKALRTTMREAADYFAR